MKMNKVLKRFAVVVMMMGLLCSTSVTAFAYVDENAATETTEAPAETPTETPVPEAPVVEENAAETEGTPFSVEGNGELLDDKTNDDTKQFITVQTKNGNTYFLVIDRSSNSENVYMLSMIDEADLAEFVDETGKKSEEEPAVVLPENEIVQETVETPELKEEPKTEEKSSNMGEMLAIILLAAAGIGAGVYFKVIKPKQEADDMNDENLEFFDSYNSREQDESDDETEDDESDEDMEE